MNLKTTLTSLFLLAMACFSLQLHAQGTVDLQFVADTDGCLSNEYCVTIQMQGSDGADFIGNSSIRFSYDPAVILFEGNDMGVTSGSYSADNFDLNDGTDPNNPLDDGCSTFGFSPYSDHSFDGLVAGDFLITLVLQAPTVINTFACPSISEGWQDVSTICFDILDAAGNPNLQFSGDQGVVPPASTDETNFNPDTNNPDNKYQNGTFTGLTESFTDFCAPGCGTAVFDNGGPTGNYGLSVVDEVTVICPDSPEQTVVLNFTEFVVEDGGGDGCWDDLQIWEDTDGDLVTTAGTDSLFSGGSDSNTGGFCGNSVADLPNGGTFVANSPGNCLLLVFNSDASVAQAGFAANIDCIDAVVFGCTDPIAENFDATATIEDGSCVFIPGCTDANALNFNPDATEEDGSCIPSCGSEFDNPIVDVTYALNADDTTVICPTSTSDFLVVSFENFTVEDGGGDGCWDDLQIWNDVDGSQSITDGDALVPGGQDTATGGFCGDNVSALPNGGVIVASTPGACMVFVFQSDGSVAQTGFDALVSCVDESELGCTDMDATNFDAAALIEDGSCLYNYDLCENAVELGTPTDSTSYGPFTNENATVSDEVASAGCFVNGDPYQSTVWMTFVGDGNDYLIIANNSCTEGNNDLLNSQIAVFEGACDGPEVACNDDVGFANDFANATLPTTVGTVYYILVDGFDGQVGDFCLEFTQTIIGCTDAGALNFNPDALTDDGSCFFTCSLLPTFATGTPATGFALGDEPEATCPTDWQLTNDGTELYIAVAPFNDAVNDPYIITVTAGQLYQSFSPPVAVSALELNNGTIGLIGLTNADFADGPVTVTMTDPQNGECVGTLTIPVFDVAVVCPLTIEGCTDPLASNFDPNANFNAGCEYGCGSSISDNGGTAGPYAVNSNDTTLICPDSDDQFLSLVFTDFIVQDFFGNDDCFDDLQIWEDLNGNSMIDEDVDSLFGGGINDLTTGGFCGDSIEELPNGGVFVASTAGTCMVLVFQSNGFTQEAGYEADILCPTADQIGCTDPVAENFDANALVDNASCEYIGGCTDIFASNFDANATLNDGSCTYVEGCGGATFDNGGIDANYAGNSDDTTVLCPDAPEEFLVLVFSEFVVEDGSASGCWDDLQIWEDTNGDSAVDTLVDSQFDGGVFMDDVTGGFCGNSVEDLPNGGTFIASTAGNCMVLIFQSDAFVAQAGFNAGIGCATADQVGCTDAIAENFDMNALFDNGTCEYIEGCTDETALNFNSAATLDDGSCIAACGSTFVDNGAADGNYELNSNDTTLLCPNSADEALVVEFASFVVEDGGASGCWDDLQIWTDLDGSETITDGDLQLEGQDNVTLGFCGDDISALPNGGTVIAAQAGACMLFVFTSDASVAQAGWDAAVNCVPESEIGCTDMTAENFSPDAIFDNGTCVFIPGCTDDTAVNFDAGATEDDGSCYYTIACGGTFTDTGGADGNYSSNENITWVFCSDNADEVILLEFAEFNTEDGDDVFSVFDGDIVNATGGLILELSGNGLPESAVFSTGQCLSVQFVSDDVLTGPGWSITVTCTADIIPGCTDATAFNFNMDANADDGSCIATCGSVYTDGPGNYELNAGGDTTVICPSSPDSLLLIAFTEFVVEDGSASGCWDDLQIWTDIDGSGSINDGDIQATSDLSDSVTGGLCGNSIADLPNGGDVVAAAQGACMLFVFTSDASVAQVGWAADITCISPDAAGCTDPIAENFNPDATIDNGSCVFIEGCTNTFAANFDAAATLDDGSCTFVAECGGASFDNGGPDENYALNSNDTVFICPDSFSELVTVSFVDFVVEDGSASGCWDDLQIWEDTNGDSVIDTLADSQFEGGQDTATGGFCGDDITALPNDGVFTASANGNCLAFILQSDGSVAQAGWFATIECESVACEAAAGTISGIQAEYNTDESLVVSVTDNNASDGYFQIFVVTFVNAAGNAEIAFLNPSGDFGPIEDLGLAPDTDYTVHSLNATVETVNVILGLCPAGDCVGVEVNTLVAGLSEEDCYQLGVIGGVLPPDSPGTGGAAAISFALALPAPNFTVDTLNYECNEEEGITSFTYQISGGIPTEFPSESYTVVVGDETFTPASDTDGTAFVNIIISGPDAPLTQTVTVSDAVNAAETFDFEIASCVKLCSANAGTIMGDASVCATDNVVVTGSDFLMDSQFTQTYIAVQAGNIVAISATGDFGVLPAGAYCIHGLNYVTLDFNPAPAVGDAVEDILAAACSAVSVCLDVTVAACDACSDFVITVVEEECDTDASSYAVSYLFSGSPNGEYNWTYTLSDGTTASGIGASVATTFEILTDVDFSLTVTEPSGTCTATYNAEFVAGCVKECSANGGTITGPMTACIEDNITVVSDGTFQANPQFTQTYIAVQAGNIVAIAADGDFGTLAAGDYCLHALNYVTLNFAPAVGDDVVVDVLDVVCSAVSECFALTVAPTCGDCAGFGITVISEECDDDTNIYTLQYVFSGSMNNDYSYEYTLGSNTPITGSSAGSLVIPSVDGSQSFELIVTDPNTGCTATYETVLPANCPKLCSAEAGIASVGNTAYCTGETVSATSTGFQNAVDVDGPLFQEVIVITTTDGMVVAFADVDDAGNASFDGLAEGDYCVNTLNYSTVEVEGGNPLVVGGILGDVLLIGSCLDVDVDQCVAFSIGGTATLAITANPADLTVCTGESVTLTASGGSDYVWSGPESDGAMTESITVTTAGTYTVSSGDCAASASVTVVVNPIPSAEITGAADICSGGSVTLTAPGAAGVTYTWSASAGNLSSTDGATTDYSMGMPGTYVITLTADANGCTASTTASITVNENPTVDITGAADICANGSVALTASSTAAGATYSWSASAGSLSNATGATSTYTMGMEGSYTVTATVVDANGCTGSADVTINVGGEIPETVALNNGPACNGSSVIVTVNAGADSYTWTNQDGDFISGSQTFTTTIAGTYTASLDYGFGCIGMASTVVENIVVNAGTLIPNGGPLDFCTSGIISASVGTAPTVPAGFEVLYVLTSGDGLVIVSTSSIPSFTAPADAGTYTIHTLVYDPLKLDLSVITPGVTTAGDVLAILGGGEVCADLLVGGAVFNVDPDACCVADAGTLVATDSDQCDDGSIAAAHVVAPTTQAGYDVVYVLTSGAGLVIEAVNTLPTFAIPQAGGIYTIHTLVYNTADVDLTAIVPGTTTAADVIALFGDACYSLDAAGAPYNLGPCDDPIVDDSSIGDFAFSDLNQDGIFNGDDQPKSGLIVTITGPTGTFTMTTDANGMYLFTDLPAGTYTVSVNSVSNYSTPTSYTVTVNGSDSFLDADFGCFDGDPILPLGSIGDTVFEDTNQNGVQDPGEPGKSGVTVTLFDGTGALLASTVTNSNGNYLFDDLEEGTYQVFVEVDANLTYTTPTSFVVVLAEDEDYVDADFGCFPTPLTGSIGDQAFFDNNGDGIFNAGDTPKADLLVTLVGPTGTFTMTTNANGTYTFSGLPAGTYTVSVNSVGDFTTPTTYTVVLAEGENFVDADFGCAAPPPCTGQIGDTVFEDLNEDGTQDAGEPGKAGVTVTLFDAAGNVITTTTTNGNGLYLFSGLCAGTYQVFVEVDADLVYSTPTGYTIVLTGDNDSDLTADFGCFEDDPCIGQIGDTVFNDINQNGVQDPGESGKPGVLVTLSGAANATATTNVDGVYIFSGLCAGTYTVSIANNPDFTYTTPTTYTITLNTDSDTNYTADFGCFEDDIDCIGQIGDVVFNDGNGNGVQDPGELGKPGVLVTLSGTNITTTTTTTNVNGVYIFSGLCAGTYTVSIANNPDFTYTTTTVYTITLNGDSDTNYTADFGCFLTTDCFAQNCTFTISGGSGETPPQWCNDSPLNIQSNCTPQTNYNTLYYYYNSSGTIVMVLDGSGTMVNGVGNYIITAINYNINDANNGLITLPVIGNNIATVGGGCSIVSSTNIAFNVIDDPAICGYKIGGFVWQDDNNQGTLDNDEDDDGIAGITVTATNTCTGEVFTTVSAPDGTFCINDSGLTPCEYEVCVGTPGGLFNTTPQCQSVTLGDGSPTTGINFGLSGQLAGCNANAGEIFLTDNVFSYCEGNSIEVSAFGFTQDVVNNHILVLVDDNGIIADVAYETSQFVSTLPGNYTIYAYAYALNGVTNPMEGEAWASYDGVGCSDTSEPIDIVINDAFTLSLEFDDNCQQVGENQFEYVVTVSVTGGGGGTFTVSGLGGDFVTDANGVVIQLPENTNYSNFSVVDDLTGCTTMNNNLFLPICSKTAVEMIEFFGRVEDAGNQLFWATATETDSKFFEVQRSFDGNDFQTIGTVDAQGISNTRTDYDFLDANAPAGISYYRLLVVDINGEQEETNIVQLERERGELTILGVSPVPTQDFLNIEFNSSIETEEMQVNIFDATGRLVKVISANHNIAYNVLRLDVSSFASGAYFVTITTTDVSQTAKFIKD